MQVEETGSRHLFNSARRLPQLFSPTELQALLGGQGEIDDATVCRCATKEMRCR